MKFYHIEPHHPEPAAGLLFRKYSDQLHGTRMVKTITPGSYEMDVYYSAKRWPDLMQSLDCLLFSECVVSAFQEAGLGGVEFYSQKIRKIDSKALQKLPAPHYHWAHALTGVPAVPGDLECYPKTEDGYIDTAAFDFHNVIRYPIDPQTGFYDFSKNHGLCLWKFDFSKWQGADLFYISTVYSGHCYCTQRFKDLAEAHKFTNFRFTGALNPEGDWFFA